MRPPHEAGEVLHLLRPGDMPGRPSMRPPHEAGEVKRTQKSFSNVHNLQ